MMKFIFAIIAQLLILGVAYADQCPPGTNCPVMTDHDKAYVAATIIATNNICSRLDPANAENYAKTMDSMIADIRDLYEEALKLKEFPYALKDVELAFDVNAKEDVKNTCLQLLNQ